MNRFPNPAHAAGRCLDFRLAMIRRARTAAQLDEQETLAAKDLAYMLKHDILGRAEIEQRKTSINQALRFKRGGLSLRRATA